MSEQWSTNWDDYASRPPLSEYYTGRVVAVMSSDLAVEATAQVMHFIESLKARPGLTREALAPLLLDEAVRRLVKGDPTAPLFGAVWRQLVDWQAFDDMIEGM